MNADRFDLERFVAAQAGAFDAAVSELREGRKRTHWMWFIFPQLRGLGQSSTAQFYGIASLAEARAYLAHPLLGPRLVEAGSAVQANAGRSLHDIFGSPDDVKFCSSMTLFAVADPTGPYSATLKRWCGQPDPLTLSLLGRSGESLAG